jgi:hypothetical protein
LFQRRYAAGRKQADDARHVVALGPFGIRASQDDVFDQAWIEIQSTQQAANDLGGKIVRTDAGKGPLPGEVKR